MLSMTERKLLEYALKHLGTAEPANGFDCDVSHIKHDELNKAENILLILIEDSKKKEAE